MLGAGTMMQSCRKMWRLATLSGCCVLVAACPVHAQIAAPSHSDHSANLVPSSPNAGQALTAEQALEPYYKQLDVPLPVTGPAAKLPGDRLLTRIAVGSCLNERRSQTVWDAIAAKQPDLFVMMGDNVYGDIGATGAADLPQLRQSYSDLAAIPQFAAFRRSVPMMTVWDDHDYGMNDGGASFAFRNYSERIFETFWASSDTVRSRPGIYDSRIIGPVGKRVQIIMLDTRYFRSDIARMPYSTERRPLGDYASVDAADATMLGDAQWQWLEGELEKPAELRLIISSIQLLSSAHHFESWGLFPRERERFYRLLADKKIGNALLLTGDRHRAGLYHKSVNNRSQPLWEMTTSSLNFSFGSGDHGSEEPDGDRAGGLWADPNFGMVEIDWKHRNVRLSLFRDDGADLESRTVGILAKP